jgi:hypothetical protein
MISVVSAESDLKKWGFSGRFLGRYKETPEWCTVRAGLTFSEEGANPKNSISYA